MRTAKSSQGEVNFFLDTLIATAQFQFGTTNCLQIYDNRIVIFSYIAIDPSDCQSGVRLLESETPECA
jgi:hypothetical protein